MSYNYYTKSYHEDPLLYLNFYNYIILVRTNESGLIEKIRQEFHYFIVESTLDPHFTINLKLESPPEMPSMVAVKLLEQAAIYRLGSRHYIDYFGEALTIKDHLEKTIEIFTPNIDRLFELAFLAIHSVLGQELDRDGLCRLHAVAITLNKTNAIVMLPSKGGKSTLLQNFLKEPKVKIISDDMPLCNTSGEILSFPSKISLDSLPSEGPLAGLKWHQFIRHSHPPKFTASLSEIKDRLESDPKKNATFLIAGLRLSSGQSILSEVPKWKMVKPMIEHMIIGFGLPQIVELFLNFNFTDLIKLPYHAAIRSLCAFNLVRKARCFYFYMGPDKEGNANLILELLDEPKNY